MNTDEMNVYMQKNTCRLPAILFLACIALLLCIPLSAFSSEKFYTVAISSFTKAAPAEKQFTMLAQKLHGTKQDHLRIEKIGRFYSVRVGKFSGYTAAKELLRIIKPLIPKATVVRALVTDERIVKMHKRPSLVTAQVIKKKNLSNPASKSVKRRAAKKITKKIVPEISSNDVQKKAEAPADKIGSKSVAEDTLDERLKRIARYVDKNDYETALKILKSKTDENSDDPHLNAWLGTVFIKMDKPSEALTHMEKAVKLSPDRADYHNALGYSLLLMERFDNAVASFHQAVSLDPLYIDAMAGLCIAYARSGNKEKAMAAHNAVKDRDKKISVQLLALIEMGSIVQSP
jgi:Flp pilus assembly protein TadD